MWVRIWSELSNGGRTVCDTKMYPSPLYPNGANRLDAVTIEAIEDALQRWGNVHIEHIEPASVVKVEPSRESSTLIGE